MTEIIALIGLGWLVFIAAVLSLCLAARKGDDVDYGQDPEMDGLRGSSINSHVPAPFRRPFWLN